MRLRRGPLLHCGTNRPCACPKAAEKLPQPVRAQRRLLRLRARQLRGPVRSVYPERPLCFTRMPRRLPTAAGGEARLHIGVGDGCAHGCGQRKSLTG